MNTEGTPSHRRVDRESGHLITRLSEKILKARGYTAERLRLDDNTLQRRELSIGLQQKKDEFELTSRGPAKTEPGESLQKFVTNARRAGYDVRLAKQPNVDYLRPYVRYDLDRFITRVPENLLADHGYSREKKQLLFHAWGDGLESCTEEQQKQYKAENEKIIRFIKNHENQNYHVRLLEKKYEDGYVLVPYTRQKNYEDNRHPFKADRPLTGITTEEPSALLARGFTVLMTVYDDGSLAVIPGKTMPIALDNAYLATIDYLQKFGTLPQNITESIPTIRKRIIQAASRGYEIRVRRPYLPPGAEVISGTPELVTLFQRFDLVRFVEPTDTDPADLLLDGFVFEINMPLTAWGDGPSTRDTESAKKQRHAIEKYVNKKEADGYMVRFVVGKYFPQSESHEKTPTYLAAFIKQKR